MIELKMIITEEELSRETGLDHDGLLKHGFDLDDWDACFISEKRLVYDVVDEDDAAFLEPIDEARWLVLRMEGFCTSLKETKYAGRYYYMVYHS